MDDDQKKNQDDKGNDDSQVDSETQAKTIIRTILVKTLKGKHRISQMMTTQSKNSDSSDGKSPEFKKRFTQIKVKRKQSTFKISKTHILIAQ
jgi:hypothetical protein